LEYACTLADAAGKPVGRDGLMRGNTLALYSHQHFGSRPEIVVNLLQAVRQEKTARQTVKGLR
jgi:cobyrinic acid a,c-diamide synthase